MSVIRVWVMMMNEIMIIIDDRDDDYDDDIIEHPWFGFETKSRARSSAHNSSCPRGPQLPHMMITCGEDSDDFSGCGVEPHSLQRAYSCLCC